MSEENPLNDKAPAAGQGFEDAGANSGLRSSTERDQNTGAPAKRQPTTIRTEISSPPSGAHGGTEDQIDVERAVEFASLFGPPNVMSFSDGAPSFAGEASPEAARRFIERHRDSDIYCSLAVLKSGYGRKPTKADCVGARYAWVDIDPPKGMTDQAMLEEWRAKVLAEVPAMDVPEPHVIVFSGRGLWLYWRLAFQVDVGMAERINFALAELFGADHCHSIDHVARVPYTRNSKTGLIGCLLRNEAGSVQPSDLPQSQPREVASADLGDLGPPQTFPARSDLNLAIAALEAKTTDKQKLHLWIDNPEAANSSRAENERIDVGDRSKVTISWAVQAVMANMPPRQVRDVLMSPCADHVSAHLLNPRHGRRGPALLERYAYRQTARAYAMAVEKGWRPKPGPEEAAAQAAKIGTVSLTPINPYELPMRPWLVEGLAMNGQVTMIAGAGGSAKSLFALQLGIMCALGMTWAHWNAKRPVKTLVVNAEDDIDEMRRRVLSACQAMRLDPNRLDDRLLTLNTSRITLLEREPGENGKIKQTPLFQKLISLVKQEQIGLLILDPLIETHAGLDENSNVDMKEVLLAIRDLARFCKVPVLIVHHSRKGTGNGHQDSARGGSALVNACRTVLTMEPMTEQEAAGKLQGDEVPDRWRYVQVRAAKSNYGRRDHDRWLHLKSVCLCNGGDPNGDLSPGLEMARFSTITPETWEHTAEFLSAVREGRNNGEPWCVAKKAKEPDRLTTGLLADRFGLDEKWAEKVFEAFMKAGLIEVRKHVTKSRNEIDCVFLADSPRQEALGLGDEPDDDGEPENLPF